MPQPSQLSDDSLKSLQLLCNNIGIDYPLHIFHLCRFKKLRVINESRRPRGMDGQSPACHVEFAIQRLT